MNEINEAVVVLCKCGKAHKTYGIRAEKAGLNHWRFTWAFPIKESSAKHEDYDKTSISGNIEWTEEYPGCPYCEKTDFTVCGCGHLCCTILKDGLFTCEWCGSTGKIGIYTGQSISAGADY